MSSLTDDGKLGIRPVDGEWGFIMELFTHVLEENSIRGRDFPTEFLAGAGIPEPGAHRASDVLKRYGQPIEGCLFKYSKLKYLEPMLERGLIRISPATLYEDPSLNYAIADDELGLTLVGQPEDISLKTMDGQTIPVIGPAKIEIRARTNFYIYCLASTYDNRLFQDFDADACLVIGDVKSFYERLQEAVLARLDRSWLPVFDRIRYVDPYTYREGEQPSVPFSKHIKYYYQREVRAAWMPPLPVSSLEPFVVEIGNLSDCCDLLRLED